MRASPLLLLLTFFLLTACGRVDVSVGTLPAPISATETLISTATIMASPTEQVNPTATLEIPSPTLALPTATQVQQLPTALPPATATSPATTEQTVKIVLIALNDNGQSEIQVGCGDSAVPVTVTIPKTQGVLRAALEKLLSAKQQYYGESGLYNALYQSDLQVAGVTIEQGKAIIHLTGTLMMGGECDAPRVEAQLKQTALQFSTVNDVAVFVNDTPLEELLSLK